MITGIKPRFRAAPVPVGGCGTGTLSRLFAAHAGSRVWLRGDITTRIIDVNLSFTRDKHRDIQEDFRAMTDTLYGLWQT